MMDKEAREKISDLHWKIKDCESDFTVLKEIVEELLDYLKLDVIRIHEDIKPKKWKIVKKK